MNSSFARTHSSLLATDRCDSRQPGRAIAPVKTLLLIAGTALLVRLLPLLLAGDHWAIMDDSREYLALVRGMASGCGFARVMNGMCGSAELYRLPGYPLLVYLMPNLRSVVVLQAFFGAATCLAVGMFMLPRWGLAAAVVAETLLAFDIPSIVASSTIMSDCLFETLLGFAILLQLSIVAKREAGKGAMRLNLLASALLGYAVLVRAVAIIVPIIAAAPFMFMGGIPIGRRLRLASVAVMLPLLVMAGWTIRNHSVSGRWVYTTEGVYNLYYYNAAGVLGYRTGENLTQLQSRLSREIGANGPNEEFSAAQQSEMARRAIAIFVHHPLDAAADALQTFVWLAIVPDRANLNNMLGTGARSTIFLAASQDVILRVKEMFHSPLLTALVMVQMPFILIMWIGVAISIGQIKRVARDRLPYMLTALVIAFAMIAVATGAAAIARFRLPAMPFLAMLAGIGWARVWDSYRQRSHSEQVVLAPEHEPAHEY